MIYYLYTKKRRYIFYKNNYYCKEKDLKLYKYFLPEIRKFLFSSFDFTPNKLKELEKLPIETQSALLSRYPCTMFEYVLEKDIQGKTGEEKGKWKSGNF